jgi:hypothetical protein
MKYEKTQALRILTNQTPLHSKFFDKKSFWRPTFKEKISKDFQNANLKFDAY